MPHHVRGLHHTLLESEVGAAQVLVSALHMALRHGKLLVSFTQLESGLADLQIDFLGHVGQLHTCHGCGGLGRMYLVASLTPVEDGHAQAYSYVEHTVEIVVERVKEVGRGEEISTQGSHLRQKGRAYQLLILPAHAHGVLQQSELRPARLEFFVGICGVNRFHASWAHQVLVSQMDISVEVKSTDLAEIHTGQCEPVIHTRLRHLGLIDPHSLAELIGASCHTLVEHLAHIIVKLSDEFQILSGQDLFLPQTHHLPVSLVNIVERGLLCTVYIVVSLSDINVGHTIGRRDGSTHIDGLPHEDIAAKEVTGVRPESLSDVLSHGVERCGQLLANGRGSLLTPERHTIYK